MHETVEIFLSLKNPMFILNLNNKLINQHETLPLKLQTLTFEEKGHVLLYLPEQLPGSQE